jgi:DNA-binding transcriptional ArsR family regulator
VNTRPGPDDAIGAVFSALADPTRRALVDRLAERPATATELALDVPVSRQAVVKHLQALDAAGLVERTRDGRSVRFCLHSDPLDDAVDWMTRAGTRWEHRLRHLREHIASDP